MRACSRKKIEGNKQMVRRTIALIAGLAVAAGMLIALTSSAPASAACKPSVTVTHSSTVVQAAIHANCGMRIAAYGNAWQTGYRVGSFKTHGYSVACVNSACTEGGGWSNGGWERLGGHVEHCTFGCGSSATLNPLGYYHGTACPKGPTQNPYMLNTLNGNVAPWLWLETSGPGAIARSYPNGGRLMYWTGIACTVNGWPMGYWKNYKKNVFSASSTCGRWELKAHTSDNGTVTIDRLGDQHGTTFIMLGSRFCNTLWKKGIVRHVWASDNKSKDPLVSMNLARPRSGLYVKWSLSPNQSARA